MTSHDFECWVGEMDDEIERLMPLLPASVRDQLDFSIESLLVLGEWLVSEFSTFEELKSAPDRLHFRLSRYVGETYLEYLDGFWYIELKDKEDVYYMLPVVRDQGEQFGSPLCLLTTAIHRRDPAFLHRLLEIQLRNREETTG